MASDHLRLGFLLQCKYLNRTTPDSVILYCYYCSLVPKFCPALPHHGLAHQPLLSTGFPRQAYWSGLPFPSPGGLPNPGIEPRPPAWQTLYHLSYLENPLLCIYGLEIHTNHLISSSNKEPSLWSLPKLKTQGVNSQRLQLLLNPPTVNEWPFRPDIV